MYLLFGKFMRGGVSYISKRYSKANNKYLKSYDTKQESKHMIYFDTNSLNGCAISKFLPTSDFKWIDPKDFDSNKYSSDSSTDCVLEVLLEYPKKLLKLCNGYRLASDKIEIKKTEMLSKISVNYFWFL